MRTGWKRWRHGTLIPEQHRPGEQKGFMQGKKGGEPKSEHSSRANGGVQYYQIIPWGKEPR